MKYLIDTRNKGSFPEQDLVEERFLEQFAALEEGLALLQNQMRGMSENAKLFGSLARHIRRSICPASLPSMASPTSRPIRAPSIPWCAPIR